MQRVSSFLPSWDKRTSSGGAKNNSGLFGWGARSVSGPATPPKLSPTINTAKANNARIKREAFWPATLDQECDKAARILKSFCVDGYLHPVDTDVREPPSDPSQPPPSPAQTIQKIPKRVIQNAAGIAVFTCMRSGLWMTGSGGSGILIARKSDGTWSPPSGIMLHTPTLSFIIGVDIYDCVLVVSNLAALETITRSRVTLGEDVSLINGPSVPLDSQEKRISWKDLDNTVLAYMKARGQHQSVNLNGCILTERANENVRFYNSEVTQMDVLAGNVSRHVEETKPLFEVIKMAEGRTDFDAAIIHETTVQPAPGDAVIETPTSTNPASPRFGVPKSDDPDPFGILALEMAGLEIREAGSRLRPASSQVDFGNSPMSPVVSKFSRQSIESMARSNRGSYMSNRTTKSQLTDPATQIDTRSVSPSPRDSDEGSERPFIDREAVDYTTVDMSSLRHISEEHAKTPVIAEEPEEIGNVVTIAKRVPPPLPRRSPARVSQHMKSEGAGDNLSVKSPLRQAFSEADLREEAATGSIDGVTDDVKSTGDINESRLSRVSDIGQILDSNLVSTISVKPEAQKVLPSSDTPADKVAVDDTKLNAVSPEIEEVPVCDNSDNAFVDAVAAAPLDTSKRISLAKSDLVQEETSAGSAPIVQGPQVVASHKERTHTVNQTHPTVSTTDDSDAAMDGDDEQISDCSDSELMDAEFSIMEPTTIRTMRLSQISANSNSKPQKLELRNSREITTTEKSAFPSRESYADDDFSAAMMAFDNLAQIDDSDSHPSTPQHEHTDASESASFKKKHSSSIYTGATDDRWSYDGSSPTTPTSDRPSSMSGDVTDEGTPKKSKRKTKELESVDHIEPLEPVDSHNGNTTPTAVTAA
ncbi:SH3 domain-containing protein [Beauveria bassiana]|nr:SH3 domain-containing protein [Beauveria bassiana]